MGGFGSGAWTRYDARLTTGACHQLDVNWLKRNGYLVPGAARWIIRGKIDGDERELLLAIVNGVRVTCEADGRLTLRYGIGSGDDWTVREQRLFFEWFPVGKGFRPYFHCPYCARRAVKLYQRGRYACRKCCNLAYASEQAGRSYRPLLKLQKLRMRLGGDPNILAPFPPRPKHMHRRTYEKLRRQAEQLEGRHVQAMLTPSFVDKVLLGGV